MSFRTCNTAVKNFLLEMIDQFATFRVDCANSTQFTGTGETVDQYFVISHDCTFIGHKVFETVYSVITTKRAHRFMNRIIPPGDCHMETVIGRGFFSPAAPGVISFQNILLWTRNHKIDNHGSSTYSTCCCSGKEIFRGNCSHEREFHVSMRINSSWHHITTSCINNIHS